MKKFTLSALFIVGITLLACSQEKTSKQPIDSFLKPLPILKSHRFLISMHGGSTYGLASTFKFFPDDIRYISVVKTAPGRPQTNTVYQTPWKGLGDGFKVGGGLTYVLSDFINIGVDVDYFKTSLQKTRDSSYYELLATSAPGGPNEYNYNERKTVNYEEKLVTITPVITFKAFSRPKWFLYSKLGGIITLTPGNSQTETSDISSRRGRQGATTDSSASVVKKYSWSIKSPALGFLSSIGIQVKVAGRLKAYTEFQFSHIVLVAKSRSMEAYTVNNRDMLNTLPVSARELKFSNIVSASSGTNTTDQPSQALIPRMPVTNLGVQLGLAFQL